MDVLCHPRQMEAVSLFRMELWDEKLLPCRGQSAIPTGQKKSFQDTCGVKPWLPKFGNARKESKEKPAFRSTSAEIQC